MREQEINQLVGESTKKGINTSGPNFENCFGPDITLRRGEMGWGMQKINK